MAKLTPMKAIRQKCLECGNTGAGTGTESMRSSGNGAHRIDFLEFHDRLVRCPLGRTDFYGARRLFFYYLDVALKERKGR